VVEQGDILGGRYRILDVLAGGMGQIYICTFVQESGDADRDTSDGERTAALKTFQRRHFYNNAARLSFIREASTWLRLSDLPHVMPVVGIEHIGDQPFVLMPAVPPGPDGERSIADLLRRGPLDPEAALAFAFQIALALRKAGDRIPGLVHGDLKPANVLLLSGDAFLSDFGLVSAVSLGRADLRLEGTWAYRAPELWGEERTPPTVATDVYAFGALLFEMLVGRPPFTANDDNRAAWSMAHRQAPPRPPDEFPATEPGTSLMALALACLAKEPERRPPDFVHLLERIKSIYGDHDPVNLLMRTARAAEISYFMRQQLLQLRDLRIRGLLSLEEPAQALEELQAIPEDEYDAELWVLRGIALSLDNRPEEALDALERGLAGELTPAQRLSALSECALALKRLGRLEEAQDLYRRLMTEVPDDQLPIVVVNLATVHLQQEDGEAARQLLEPFVRKMPGLPEAWGNLGLSYEQLGRYDDAVEAFGKALVLAPQTGAVRVSLAAVYMDHLGLLEEAWAALDAAFDAGYESREWFVRMLASSLLLDRGDMVDGMLYAAQNNFPDELGRALVEESIAMARQLAEKYVERSVAESPDVTTADEQMLRHGDPEETVDAVRADIGAEQSPASAGPSFPSTAAHDVDAAPGLPFLNFRFYDFFDFTVDYYESVTAPDFVQSFLGHLRRATRDPRFTGGSGAPLRGSPFYFTICAGCGVTVLTNRDAGKRMNCRMCGTGGPTDPVHGPVFDSIVAEVSAELGIQPAAAADAPDVHVLFVQSPHDDVSDVVGEVCRQAGMVRLAPNLLISVHMLREATSRGLARLQDSWSAWALRTSQDETWARDSTPRPLAAVVRELQHRAPGVRTLTTTLTTAEMAEMSATVEEVEQEEERSLRAAVRSGEAQAQDLRRLASLLDRRGSHPEAERTARAAIAADENSAEGWEVLGTALFHQQDFVGARDALEESLSRDPTSVLVLTMLQVCCQQLGDDDRAAEFHARRIGYTGGQFA
jgi:serine/threonine protein kinase